MKHEFTFYQSPSEKHKGGELNQLIDLGTCGVHTTHIAFKQKLQIGNTKNWCHLWAEYSMKHLVGVRSQNCYWSTEKEYLMQYIIHRWVENDVTKKQRWYGQKLLK